MNLGIWLEAGEEKMLAVILRTVIGTSISGKYEAVAGSPRVAGVPWYLSRVSDRQTRAGRSLEGVQCLVERFDIEPYSDFSAK